MEKGRGGRGNRYTGRYENSPGRGSRGNRGRGGRGNRYNQNEDDNVSLYLPENEKIVSKYIDTHCHLEYIFEKKRLTGGYTELLQTHQMPHNYEGCIGIFCDPAAFSSFGQWEQLLAMDTVYGAFGCHPHNAKYYNDSLVGKIINCLQHPKAVAWGEIGLDYNKNNSPAEKQREVFMDQILKAVSLNKPIIVHSRDAEKDTYDILKKCLPQDWPVHVHCFTDTRKQAEILLKDFSQLYIGVTGVLTYQTAEELRWTVTNVIPLDRLLLETDAPYMSPKPFKGVCHPGYIPLIAKEISILKNIPLEEVYSTIRLNTTNIYKI